MMTPSAPRAGRLLLTLGATLLWLGCGDAESPGDVAPAERPMQDAASTAVPVEPSDPGHHDDLRLRAEQALAELDSSPRAIRGQVGGPIEIPSGLPQDLPLPVDATPLPAESEGEGVLVLSVAHPLDQTRGFFRSALRGRGFEIVSDARNEEGFELRVRRPSEELLIAGERSGDATRVSIATPEG